MRQTVRVLALAAWLAPAAAAAQGPDKPPDPQDHQEHQAGPTSPVFVRAFGAVNWGAADKPTASNSFALGQLALFATSALSERVSVLAEIVMEGSRDTRVVTDLERLELTLRFNDSLHLSAGRYHTGIGFYNTAFHHGAYFETLIGRPRIFSFEDEGGVLPVHELGLSARGAIPKTGGALHYLAEVGNGRSWDEGGEDIATSPDTNSAKSFNLGLSLRPQQVNGLEFGTSFYRDRIPRAEATPVENRILAVYAVYRTPLAEVMAEWLRLSYQDESGTYVSRPGYVQVSHAWGRLRPYYRYDRQIVAPGSPVIGFAADYEANIAGLRIDTPHWVGLKVQYERYREGAVTGINAVRTQMVFVF
jgi:hypothetical protein